MCSELMHDTPKIIAFTNEENRDLGKWLCEIEKFAKAGRLDLITNILRVTNKNNVGFAKWICEEDFMIPEDDLTVKEAKSLHIEDIKDLRIYEAIRYISSIIEPVNENNEYVVIYTAGIRKRGKIY